MTCGASKHPVRSTWQACDRCCEPKSCRPSSPPTWFRSPSAPEREMRAWHDAAGCPSHSWCNLPATDTLPKGTRGTWQDVDSRARNKTRKARYASTLWMHSHLAFLRVLPRHRRAGESGARRARGEGSPAAARRAPTSSRRCGRALEPRCARRQRMHIL